MPGKADSEVKAMDTALNALSPLDQDEQRRVLSWLTDKLKLSGSVSPGPPPLALPATPQQATVPPPPGGPGSGLTPKQFMAEKKPKTDAERITCLAYYMTNQRGTKEFKTNELTALNKEGAGSPFSNAAVAANNAMRDQYMAPAGGGKEQITVRGEAVVEALPDRSKVQAALQERPARRRKPSKTKRRKSA
jgi:hypothetical protein